MLEIKNQTDIDFVVAALRKRLTEAIEKKAYCIYSFRHSEVVNIDGKLFNSGFIFTIRTHEKQNIKSF